MSEDTLWPASPQQDQLEAHGAQEYQGAAELGIWVHKLLFWVGSAEFSSSTDTWMQCKSKLNNTAGCLHGSTCLSDKVFYYCVETAVSLTKFFYSYIKICYKFTVRFSSFPLTISSTSTFILVTTYYNTYI